MEFLVDILIPTYNHEEYIKYAIEGVLMQKVNFNFKLIIHDDASTDTTPNIIREYEKKYPEIVQCIYQTANQHSLGIPNSVILFPKAKAKYIAICEGDDYWTDPLKLQKQVDFLEANPDYVFCFHKILINKGKELIEDYITNVPRETTALADLFNANYIHTPSVVFRNIIKPFPNWFKRAMPGDYPMWMMLAAKQGGKIKYIDEAMAVYRVHADGMWSMKKRESFNQRVSFTLLLCAKEINTNDVPFIKHSITELSQSIYAQGYKNLGRLEYLSHAWWAVRRLKLSSKEVFDIFTPSFRSTFKKFLKKLVIKPNLL